MLQLLLIKLIISFIVSWLFLFLVVRIIFIFDKEIYNKNKTALFVSLIIVGINLLFSPLGTIGQFISSVIIFTLIMKKVGYEFWGAVFFVLSVDFVVYFVQILLSTRMMN